MSILTIARGVGRHRGKTPLQLRTELDTAERKVASLTAAIDQISAERNQLERQLDDAAIDLSTALDDVRIARGETKRAMEALTAIKAQLANATAVSDLPQHTSTQPIPTLQQRFENGIPVRLGASPLAVTDPGRVPPSWAREDDTVPVPAVRDETVEGVA